MSRYRFDSEPGGRCLIYENGQNTVAVATCYNVQMANKIVNALNGVKTVEKDGFHGVTITIDPKVPKNVVVFVHPDGRREGFKVKS